MTHARTFTLAPAADPIHAAITRHSNAYDAFQTAPEGDEALFANDDYDAASDALVATACTTRFGALALLDHLRWWLADEAEFSAGHQPAYGHAQARAADLTLFLGTNLPPVAISRAMPLGHLAPAIDRQHRHAAVALHDEPTPGEIEPWQAVAPVRPDTAYCRALRFLDATGEALAAVAIIAGGVGAYGFLPIV